MEAANFGFTVIIGARIVVVAGSRRADGALFSGIAFTWIGSVFQNTTRVKNGAL
jgi:hypothetical protein